jgi:DNA-binding beta-propeller fold protein YncE
VTASTGIISTIAGTGVSSYSGDGGLATSATLNYPQDVALDLSGKQVYRAFFTLLFKLHILFFNGHCIGNVYIADTWNNRIRKVTVSTDIITTIAGSSTIGSFSGDGGAATSGNLYYPYGISLDSSGNYELLSYIYVSFI